MKLTQVTGPTAATRPGRRQVPHGHGHGPRPTAARPVGHGTPGRLSRQDGKLNFSAMSDGLGDYGGDWLQLLEKLKSDINVIFSVAFLSITFIVLCNHGQLALF